MKRAHTSALIQVFEYVNNNNNNSNKLYTVYSRKVKLFVFTKETPCTKETPWWSHNTQLVIRSPDYVTASNHRGYTILKGGTPHWSLEWLYTEYGIKVSSLSEDEKRILCDAEVMLSL